MSMSSDDDYMDFIHFFILFYLFVDTKCEANPFYLSVMYTNAPTNIVSLSV